MYPTWKNMPQKLPITSDWNDDDEEEDQVKEEDKDKGSEQKTPKTSPRFFAVMILTLKSPKLSITEYFGKMSCITPIMDTPEEEHRYNTIAAKQEHKIQNQDTLEDIGWTF